MSTRKVKRRRNSDTKNRQQRITTKLPPWYGLGPRLVCNFEELAQSELESRPQNQNGKKKYK